MKAYLAAPYGARGLARTLADDLRSNGCEVTSGWLNETADITPGTERAATALADDVVRAHVLNDFADIRKADVLILLTAAFCGVEGGGGRHVETGYAMGRLMPIVVVGEPENVFHRAGEEVAICATWAEALNHVRSLVELLPMFDTAKCRQCGCTDDFACCNGCSWVEADLCSACAAAVSA